MTGIDIRYVFLKIRFLNSNLFYAVIITIIFPTLDALVRGALTFPPDDWYVELAYISGFVFAGAMKGVVIALVVFFGAGLLSKLRIKTYSKTAIWLGHIIYWLGNFAAAYCLLVALYVAIVLLDKHELNKTGISFMFTMLESGLVVWFLTGGVTYLLTPDSTVSDINSFEKSRVLG